MRVFRMKNLCLVMAMILAILPLFSYMAIAEDTGLSIIENPVDEPKDEPIDEPDDPDKPVVEEPVNDGSGGEAPATMEVDLVVDNGPSLGDLMGPLYTSIFYEEPFVFLYKFEFYGEELWMDGEQIYPVSVPLVGGDELSLTEQCDPEDVFVAFRYNDLDELCMIIFKGGGLIYNEPLEDRGKIEFKAKSPTLNGVSTEDHGDSESDPLYITPFGLKYSVELVEEDGNQIQRIKVLHTNISAIATGQGVQFLMEGIPEPSVVSSTGELCYPPDMDLDPEGYNAKPSPYYMDFDFGFDSLTLDYGTDDFIYWGDVLDIPDFEAPETIQPWQLFFKVFRLGQWPLGYDCVIPDPPEDEESLEGEAFSEDLFLLPGILMVPDLNYIMFENAIVSPYRREGEYYSELNAYYMFRTDRARPFEYWILENGETLEENHINEDLFKEVKYYIVIDDAYYIFNCDSNGRLTVPTFKYDEHFYLDDFRSERCKWFYWDENLVEEMYSKHLELVDLPKYLDSMDVDFIIEWLDPDDNDVHLQAEGGGGRPPEGPGEEPDVIQINDIMDHTMVFDDYIDYVAVNDFDFVNLKNDAVGTILHTYDFNTMAFTDEQFGIFYPEAMGIANADRHALFLSYSFLFRDLPGMVTQAEAEVVFDDEFGIGGGQPMLNTVDGWRVWDPMNDDLGEDGEADFTVFPQDGNLPPYEYFRSVLLGKGFSVATSPEAPYNMMEESLEDQWWMPPWMRWPELQVNYSHFPAKEIWAEDRFNDFWYIGFYFNRELVNFEEFAEDQSGENYYTMSPLKFVAPMGMRDYVILKTGGEEFGTYWHDMNFVMPLKLGINGKYTAYFDNKWIPLVDNEFEVTLYDEIYCRVGDLGGGQVPLDMEEECYGMYTPTLPLRVYAEVDDVITDEYLEYMAPEGEFMFEEYFSPMMEEPTPDMVGPEFLLEDHDEPMAEVDREFFLNMSARFADFFNTYTSVPKYGDWNDTDHHLAIEDKVQLTRIRMNVDYDEYDFEDELGEKLIDYQGRFRYYPVTEFQIDYIGEMFGEEVPFDPAAVGGPVETDFEDVQEDEFTQTEFSGMFGWTLENMSREFPPPPFEIPDLEEVYKPFKHDLTPTAMRLFLDDEFEVVEEDPGVPNRLIYHFGDYRLDEFDSNVLVEPEIVFVDKKARLMIRVYNNIPEVVDGNDIYHYESFRYSGESVKFILGADEEGYYLMLDREACESDVNEAAALSEDLFEDHSGGGGNDPYLVSEDELFEHKFRIGNIEDDIMVMFDRRGKRVIQPQADQFAFEDAEEEECNDNNGYKDNQDTMIYHTVGEWMLEDRSDYGVEFDYELYEEDEEQYWFAYGITGMQGVYYGKYDSEYVEQDPAYGFFNDEDSTGQVFINVDVVGPVEDIDETKEPDIWDPEDYYLTNALYTEALVGGTLETVITNTSNIRIQRDDDWPDFKAYFMNYDDFVYEDEKVYHRLTEYGMDKFIEEYDMVSEVSGVVTYLFGEGTENCTLVDAYGVESDPIDLTGIDQSDPANRMISFTQSHVGYNDMVYYNHPDLPDPVPMGDEDNAQFRVIFHERKHKDYKAWGEELEEEFSEERRRYRDKYIHVLYDSLYDVPEQPSSNGGGSSSGGGRRRTTTTETILDEEVALGLPEYMLPYIAGYPGKVFIPDNYLTRQELATIVYRLSGMTPVEMTMQTFPDVGPEMWSYNYIETVTTLGLMEGQFNGNFGLYSPMTMGQFFETMSAYLDYFDIEYVAPEESPFGLPVTTMNYDDLLRVYATGALEGYDDISTLDLVMRKDAVRIINRLIGRSTEFETAQDPIFLDVTILHPYFYDIQAAAQAVTPVASQ